MNSKESTNDTDATNLPEEPEMGFLSRVEFAVTRAAIDAANRIRGSHIKEKLADERGDVVYNLDLATKRAKEIYTFLIKNGINPQQIKLQSLGEAIYDEKCSPNCDEIIHSKYRRADFEIR